MCIIFSQAYFDSLRPRSGTDRDVKALERCYSLLGFTTAVYNDLTRDEIMSQVASFKETIPLETGCFVCCILTHGGNGDLLWARDAAYHLDDIVQEFTAKRCPALAGKPKVFIVQVRT